MMARTFLTELVAIVYRLCKYTTKYGAAIIAVLDEPEAAIFQALVAACTAFMQSSIVDQAKHD